MRPDFRPGHGVDFGVFAVAVDPVFDDFDLGFAEEGVVAVEELVGELDDEGEGGEADQDGEDSLLWIWLARCAICTYIVRGPGLSVQ